MKTLQEFISQYNGVKCGNTDANFGQCVGLVSLWMDNLGIPHEWGNAKDLLTNADKTYVDVIYNTPLNSPKAGDIIVFNSSWGDGYGHTGIVTQASMWYFTLFEQNNPPGYAPHILQHGTSDYFSVSGWLHPKVQTLTDAQKIEKIKQTINSSLSDTDYRIWERKFLGV